MYTCVTYYFQSYITFLRDLLYKLLLKPTLFENHIPMYSKAMYGDIGIHADRK